MNFTDEKRRTIKNAFRAALNEISAHGDEYKQWGAEHGVTIFATFIRDSGFPELAEKIAYDKDTRKYFHNRILMAADNEKILGWSLYEDNCKRDMEGELVKVKALSQVWGSELERVKKEYAEVLKKKIAIEDHMNDEFIPD